MDKLSGIQSGDRVRVTFEGTVNVDLPSSYLDIKIDGAGTIVTTFNKNDLDAASFTIERIEKPLDVGDRVVPSKPSHCYGEILAISGDKAWVFWEHNNTHVTLNVTDIVRRPEYRA